MNRTSLEKRAKRGAGMSGFTLVEFMAAMLMFAVIAGSTFSLFSQHAPYFTSQQNLAGTNIAMQNAITQMQLDLANAGTGYYPGANIPSWPVGVSIVNQLPTAPCNDAATYTYSSECFDTLNILTMNPNVAPVHPTDATGGTNSGNCSAATGTTFYVQPYAPVGAETMAHAATRTAASFSIGDQLILITASNGGQVNTFVITGAPTAGSNYVAFSHLASNTTYFTNGPANDPIGFTANSIAQSTTLASKLGNQFCAQDWVMKLEPTTYSVDTSVPSDPKLDRIQGGVTNVIAEQVIGFKIGVATWNDATTDATSSCDAVGDTGCYHFNPADYYDDFTLVRSVRISLIGRTNPNPDPTYTFRNTFDNGPYQVVGSTVVVNPRNMSMND
ncbi:MAG: prepilin-type N-terminal cleavage/methylation domain-containing protein [Candidatus Acidiferrales bacterium]